MRKCQKSISNLITRHKSLRRRGAVEIATEIAMCLRERDHKNRVRRSQKWPSLAQTMMIARRRTTQIRKLTQGMMQSCEAKPLNKAFLLSASSLRTALSTQRQISWDLFSHKTLSLKKSQLLLRRTWHRQERKRHRL